MNKFNIIDELNLYSYLKEGPENSEIFNKLHYISNNMDFFASYYNSKNDIYMTNLHYYSVYKYRIEYDKKYLDQQINLLKQNNKINNQVVYLIKNIINSKKDKANIKDLTYCCYMFYIYLELKKLLGEDNVIQ